MKLNVNKAKSIYIHIPFCEHICAYCDFTKLIYNERFAKDYVDVLLYEIDSYSPGKMDTIYIGGGTPTSLCDEDFERILKKVSILLNEGGEFSVEANVENLSKEKLLLMKKYGVNRLSIGVESTHDNILKEINRHHTFYDAINKVRLAKEMGFSRINVDLIYGLPNQKKTLLVEDLKNLLSLDVGHISIYSLSVNPGSMFYNRGIKELDQDESREQYDLILETLREHGYKRYEISNFARKKEYSRHNLTYWRDLPYIGVGLGASGYIGNIRYTNTRSLSEYLKGNYITFKEEIDEKRHLEDYLMLNLRLEDGFKLKDFEETFGYSFKDKFADVVDQSLIVIDDETVRLTDDGLMILDRVLLKLFSLI